jgi:Flp pilus assembly protein TadD
LGAPGAREQLAAILRDADRPAIVRASAAQRLGRRLDPGALLALAGVLADRDPLLRGAAVEALSEADPLQRRPWLAPRLGDPVRSVRIAAARALATLAPTDLPEAQRPALAQAVAEWTAAQELNADRPEALVNLGTFHAERGDSERAFAAFARALALDPTFAPALVNRADLLRVLGREAEAEATLRDAIARSPRDGDLHHVLGLSLVRQRRGDEALAELGRAVELAPGDPRFAYVYGVALHDLGRGREAVEALEAALRRHPYDRDVLVALVSYLEADGQAARALAHARRLAEIEPGDPQVRALVARLEASRPR